MKLKQIMKELKEVWQVNKILFIVGILAFIITLPIVLLNRKDDREV